MRNRGKGSLSGDGSDTLHIRDRIRRQTKIGTIVLTTDQFRVAESWLEGLLGRLQKV